MKKSLTDCAAAVVMSRRFSSVFFPSFFFLCRCCCLFFRSVAFCQNRNTEQARAQRERERQRKDRHRRRQNFLFLSIFKQRIVLHQFISFFKGIFFLYYSNQAKSERERKNPFRTESDELLFSISKNEYID